MKIFRILGRSFVNACKSLVRNFSLTVASITCTVITLILVSIGLLISYNVREITNNIEKELSIVIFMEKDATSEEIETTKANLEKVENVESVIYTSKEDIKEEFSNDAKWSDIIGTLDSDENPFQDSFEVRVKDVRDINETVTTIKNMDKIETVKYGESSVNDLVSIFDGIKTAAYVLVIALSLVTAFLITNTIKITIFSRRKEIDIMRLVGTSNGVIKLPYLLEGFLIGLIGSIIPILITIFGYTVLYEKISNLNVSSIIGVITLSAPSGIIYTASLFLVILGAGVGMFASTLAVRKYLKV
jgi:cell division transport system permease protein